MSLPGEISENIHEQSMVAEICNLRFILTNELISGTFYIEDVRSMVLK